jgi:hypothetical protein
MVPHPENPVHVPKSNRSIQDTVAAKAAGRPAVPVLQQQPAAVVSGSVVQRVLEKELSTGKLYSFQPDTGKRYFYSGTKSGKFLFYEHDDMGQNEIAISDLDTVSEAATKHEKEESDDEAPTKKKQKTSTPVENDFVKKSFAPVQADATIPDLPADKAAAWAVAIKDTTQRQRVLDEMFTYVKGAQLFQATSGHSTLEDAAGIFQGVESAVTVIYKDSIKNVAAAEYDRPKGTSDIFKEAKVIFGTDAFISLPRLYSAFRHEMIHVGQLLMEPDENTSKDDPLLFDLHIDWIGKKTKKKGVINLLKELQEAIKEVETHVWELENADRTGIKGDTEYVRITYDWLYIYLCKIRNAHKQLTTKKARDGVKGYLVKVTNMVNAFVNRAPILGNTEKLTLALDNKTEKEGREAMVAVVNQFGI